MTGTHSLPLFIQISEMLIRDIQAGRLADGGRLPPEREMAEQLGLAVGTLRKALAELTEKGLLERRQGSGNYVRAPAGATGIYAFFRLELVDGGGLPTAEILTVDTCKKPAILPAFGKSKRAHRIRRLRRLNGEPAALEEIWLDASYAKTLEMRDLSESLYLFYKDKLGLWIQRVEDRVGIARRPVWGHGLLDVSDSHLGLVDRKSWDQSNEIAEISRTWFNPDKVRYVSRLR